MGKTRYFGSLVFVMAMLFLPLTTKAFTVHNGADLVFGSNDKFDGTTYAAAERITVDTPLPGDLICAGRSVVVNQPIDGDVICAASDLTINAKVSGSIRSIGENVKIDNQVGRNVMLAGADIILGDKTEVKGETVVAGEFFESRGQYLKSVLATFDRASLFGKYAAPIRLFASSENEDSLQIMSGAKLENDLTYSAYKTVKISDQAEIKGQVLKKDWPSKKNYSKDKIVGSAWQATLQSLMLILIGLIILGLWPKLAENLLEKVGKQPVKNIAKGLLWVIFLPIGSFILLFTIIGLPLGLILFALWCILLYLAKLPIGLWLGHKLLPKAKKHNWPLIVGVVSLIILVHLPLAGWLLGMVATWWGVGLICQEIRKTIK
ncbi:MAG TPA: hypothetical protein PKN62_01450 [bacterium]|nr:hypothetical protein [bacterium]